MAIVNKVNFQIQTDMDTCIKYQILTYCFFKNVLISNSDLKFLMELSKNNKIELTQFCNMLVDMDIFKSPQSARNAITKQKKNNYLLKME